MHASYKLYFAFNTNTNVSTPRQQLFNLSNLLLIPAQSPTYGLQTLPKIIRTPTPTTTTSTAQVKPLPAPVPASMPSLSVTMPAIAVTPSGNQLPDSISSPLPKRSLVSRGSVPDARQVMYLAGATKQR